MPFTLLKPFRKHHVADAGQASVTKRIEMDQDIWLMRALAQFDADTSSSTNLLAAVVNLDSRLAAN